MKTKIALIGLFALAVVAAALSFPIDGILSLMANYQ